MFGKFIHIAIHTTPASSLTVTTAPQISPDMPPNCLYKNTIVTAPIKAVVATGIKVEIPNANAITTHTIVIAIITAKCLIFVPALNDAAKPVSDNDFIFSNASPAIHLDMTGSNTKVTGIWRRLDWMSITAQKFINISAHSVNAAKAPMCGSLSIRIFSSLLLRENTASAVSSSPSAWMNPLKKNGHIVINAADRKLTYIYMGVSRVNMYTVRYHKPPIIAPTNGKNGIKYGMLLSFHMDAGNGITENILADITKPLNKFFINYPENIVFISRHNLSFKQFVHAAP